MRRNLLALALSAVFVAAHGCGDELISLNDPCAKEHCDVSVCGDKCEEFWLDFLNRDSDGDTIPDYLDNCPNVYNPDQKDSNGNGIGDACEEDNGEKWVDTDGDTVPDHLDNCPTIYNPDQKDSNGNGIGDACEEDDGEEWIDTDGDTIPDHLDNCPTVYNPDQADFNNDGRGDACAAGTQDDPFVISVGDCGVTYRDVNDTSKSTSSLIDAYPGFLHLDESGPEFYYIFKVTKTSRIDISLDAEPAGVDVDIHLLSSLSPLTLVARADRVISQVISPGTYWIVADTYVSNGKPMPGKYGLNVTITPNAAGTKDDPILIGCGPVTVPSAFIDQRSTVDATSNIFTTYPGHENLLQNGPEYIYKFTLREKARFHANLRTPEPSGTDIDLHLLADLAPTLIARSDNRIWRTLDPGTYYLVLDTYQNKRGRFILDVQFRPVAVTGAHTFNDYILKAVDHLEANWARRGYGSSAYTHDLPYGTSVVQKGPLAPLTMCVAAVAETILVAMDIYAKETGDTSVWDHLPARSWASQTDTNIKGHIWVKSSINAGGTSDALTVFGMGMTVPFEELVPGSFVNLNRTGGTGHAVVFLSFLDTNCNEYSHYRSDVVGFKYYSSQGTATNGGFDYRYAVFDGKTVNNCPANARRDTTVIRTDRQNYLNTGIMYHPSAWLKTSLASSIPSLTAPIVIPFDEIKFDGVTIDDAWEGGIP